MRLLVIQNDSDAPLGILGHRMQSRGIVWDTIHPAAGDRVPADVGDHAGLVVLGGPQSAARFDVWPYLAAEAALMSRAVSADLPVMGICLGGQLLARALGGQAHEGAGEEIGYVPILPAISGDLRERSADAVFDGLDAVRLPAWHKDSFDVPRDADWLLRSATCPGQAFRVGRAYGVQFHFEADVEIFGNWHRQFAHRHEVEEPGITQRVADEIVAFAPAAEALGAVIADRWLDLVQV